MSEPEEGEGEEKDEEEEAEDKGLPQGGNSYFTVTCPSKGRYTCCNPYVRRTYGR